MTRRIQEDVAVMTRTESVMVVRARAGSHTWLVAIGEGTIWPIDWEVRGGTRLLATMRWIGADVYWPALIVGLRLVCRRG